ncbi:MAG: RNA polymerase sigma factor [Planctomycetota bacterium]
MSDSSAPLDPSAFAQHAAFVRRLARRLESDEAAAEDLAQETWLAAVMRPQAAEGLRAWLASVLRNKSTERRRREGIRAPGPTSAADATADREPEADTAELVERMELQQLAVRIVLDLPEPYRDVLVRRFSREEEVAEIAARLGIPEETVRTRLRRGLERVRARMRTEVGGSSALLLASLRELTGVPAAAKTAAQVATAGSFALPLTLTLLMKKLIVACAIAAVAAGVLWSLLADPRGRNDEVAAVLEQEPDELASIEEPDLAVPQSETTQRLASASEAEAAPEESPESEPAEDGKMGEVVLRIEDAYGAPISQAKLHATSWSAKEEPNASVSWMGGEARGYMGESGADGVVKLRYQREYDWSDVGLRTLATVGFTVTHPDYRPHEQHRLDVSEGETVIVLERGSFLIVSGWLGSPDRIVSDVTPHLTFGARVGPDDWLPIRDGRPSCSRIPEGSHAVYLSHVDGDGRTWFSAVEPFTIAKDEQKELALELVPSRVLRGALDAAVPRPVEDGEVELNLYVDTGSRGAEMLRTYRAEIAVDGTFELRDLPPGRGEMIGICRGWASKQVLAPMPADLGEPLASGAEAPEPRRQHQHVEADAETFELRMEPTGTVEVTLVDPSGAPVEGAFLQSSPNVHWEIGYAAIFMDRSPGAKTDAEGVAVLENLPAGASTPVQVNTNGRFRLPCRREGDEGSRDLSFRPRSGETIQERVQMEHLEERDD